MLDYPEYDVSLATGVQDLQAIKPNYMAIKKSDMAQARRLGVGGGGGVRGVRTKPPTAWKGPLGGHSQII